MPRIPFPNIPPLPGVPALPRLGELPPVLGLVSGLIQETLLRVLQGNARWGVFDVQGRPLAAASNFTNDALNLVGLAPTLSTSSMAYAKETQVSDFPLEQGSFAAYNKVEMAATPTVVLTFAGSENDRRAFLENIDFACKSTDLFSVVTPEITYINYSIERYNYERRSNRGATLLVVELALIEVREVSAAFANPGINAPQDVGATPPVDEGKVQPQPRKESTLKSLLRKLGF